MKTTYTFRYRISQQNSYGSVSTIYDRWTDAKAAAKKWLADNHEHPVYIDRLRSERKDIPWFKLDGKTWTICA